MPHTDQPGWMQQNTNPYSAMPDHPAHPDNQTTPEQMDNLAKQAQAAHLAAFSWMPQTHLAIDLRTPEH